MIVPDQNILTSITSSFTTATENAVGFISPYALGTLLIITLIAIITTTLHYIAIEDSRNTDIMFYAKKNLPILFRYGSFTFMITYYGTIINALISSFFKIGGLAGGTPIQDTLFSNPSVISETGLKLMMPVWNNYVSNNIGNIMVDLTLLVAGAATGGITSSAFKMVNAAMGSIRPNSLILLSIMIIITLLVIACFFIMAVNVFVIQIEFAIVASLFLILIPFGNWNKTEFIFNNASSTFINIGIKYMVLTTIMSISMAILTSIQLSINPSYVELLFFLLMMAGLTAMTIFLPNKIAAEMQ